jgi:hypothetical protein
MENKSEKVCEQQVFKQQGQFKALKKSSKSLL